MNRVTATSGARRRSARSIVALAVVVQLLGAPDARAGETDQFYLWRRAVPDSADALNAHLDEGFRRGLDGVNRRPWAADMACIDVVDAMMAPLTGFEFTFFAGGRRGHAILPAPESNTEVRERYDPQGMYRFIAPWNVGLRAPLRPSVRAGDVAFGLDKIGHFLSEGARGYRRVLAARAAGLDEARATEAAMQLGVEQELGMFGGWITGVFSYADLEANASGVRFVRALCDGPRPALRVERGEWILEAPLDLRRFVTSCWDESVRPNAYLRDGQWDEVRRGLQPTCRLRERPDVRAARAAAARAPCDEDLDRFLAREEDAGRIPLRARFTLEEACR